MHEVRRCEVKVCLWSYMEHQMLRVVMGCWRAYRHDVTIQVEESVILQETLLQALAVCQVGYPLEGKGRIEEEVLQTTNTEAGNKR